MHRIDTSTALKDKFGSGKNGYTDGDPSTGRQATDLDADMFDELQEEISAPIEAAGMTLKKGVRNQLLTALKKLFLAGDDSRVSGALQKDENLSDVADASTTLANIGGVPTTRKINGKALSADITLSAGDVSAFPAAGGTVGSSGVITPGLHVNSNTSGAAGQGTHLLWNESAGRGEADFICNAGGGIGGFIFRTVNNDNTQEFGRVDITGTGSLNTGNTLNEMSQRVYSPNNPPPITNSAITSIRRGGQAYSAGSGTGTGRTWEAPSGCYMTGINTDVSDGRGMGVYYRSVQAYSAAAGWVQIGDES